MKKITYTEALLLAANAHNGQKDKGGNDYIKHPLTLAMSLKEKGYDDDYQIAGLLHDVVEDTDITFDDLEREGVSDNIIDALKLLTHVVDKAYIKSYIDRTDKLIHPNIVSNNAKENEYLYYIKDIYENDIATAVKLADLEHNSCIHRLKSFDERSKNRMIKYGKAVSLLTCKNNLGSLLNK